MFELLSTVQDVPVDKNSLTTVHRGMNKVSVSVGKHNSEPSEVYIITGRHNGKLQTYIIFYMLKPGIRVVYGFDQNPYEHSIKEQVLQEATDFVEEMGSILEEIPVESMTQEQRDAWFESEILYSGPVLDLMEDLEEIQDLEMVQIEDELNAVDALLEEGEEGPEGEIVVVSDEEVREVLADGDGDDEIGTLDGEYSETGDTHEEEAPGGEKSTEGVGAASSEDVVVAEGDFDELLKQAFLKPDVVEKTRKKPRLSDDEDIEEGQMTELPDEVTVDELSGIHEPEAAGAHEVLPAATGQDIPHPAKQSQPREFGPAETAVAAEADTLHPDTGPDPATESEAGLNVIRFLSKF